MMKKLALILGLLCSPAFAANPTAKQVVEEFCNLDLSGARLHSTEDAPIWKLTLDDGEPQEGPVVIIRGYSIENAVEKSEHGEVTVRYTILGVIAGDQLHKPDSTKLATGQFKLEYRDGWKISLRSLKVPPHVSPDAYSKHIDLLIQAINRKSPEKRDVQREKSLNALKASLLKLR
jgi:hypothetical protein